jgi:tetratricopeptide (TPR) repeat protein
MTYRFATRIATLVVSALLFLTSLVCTQIPLLNYLGFEYSIFNAILAGFLVGLLTVLLWNADLPVSESGYWTSVAALLRLSCVIVLIPLIVIAANAFFVKNCSFTQGFRLYVLYVLPSVCFCSSLGAFTAVFARKYRKTFYVFLFILVLSQIPFVTLTRPQIFAFNPIAGYFPGFTYDETIGGELRLLVYRVGTLGGAAMLFTLAAILVRARRGESRLPAEKNWSLRYIAVLITSLIICGSLYVLSDTLGFSSSTKLITQELGGIQRTWHFTIVYPKKSVNSDRLRQIALMHEYLFEQLRKELGVTPRRTITVFLYNSPGQKERLIGAARTDFTKPWLGQVHINLEDVDAVLKHELVHAMLAEKGIPVLQVAPNSGLIEGAAVAEERFEYGESLHHLAAQMMAIGINPDVTDMFTALGFFKSYSGVSYVMAGSFCRYLIDRYGMTRFENVYGSGRFQSSYKKSLDTLAAEWKRVVGSIKLSKKDRVKAAYLFKRRPLFGRECARVIANLNQKTSDLLRARDYGPALASAEQSIVLSRSAEAVIQKSNALFRLGDYATAIDFVQGQLSDTTVGSSLIPLRLILGDSYWAFNDFQAAMTQYEDVLSDSISLSMNEAAAIRLEIVRRQTTRESFKPYFLKEMNDSTRMSFLDSLEANPDADFMARYLLGREYSAKKQSDGVVRELGNLQRMTSRTLEFIRNRRIAQAYFDLGNLERAKSHYWQALNDAANEAQFEQTTDALQYCSWIQGFR